MPTLFSTSLVLILSTGVIFGYGSIRNAWVDHYDAGPNLQSMACQLCHAESSGGQPWNAYGWAIRQEYDGNGRNLINAFIAVESQNSDNDSGGYTNLAEILADTPPGWTTGAVNPWFYSSFLSLIHI